MRIKDNFKHLFYYLVIGGLAAIIDYGVFYLIKNITNFIPETASLIGQAAGFLFSFFMNTYLNFKKTDKLFRRFISYLVIILIGMIISTLLIALLKNLVNIYALKLFCMILVSIIQYILNKLITYRL